MVVVSSADRRWASFRFCGTGFRSCLFEATGSESCPMKSFRAWRDGDLCDNKRAEIAATARLYRRRSRLFRWSMAKHHDEVAMPMEFSRNGQETSEDRLVRAFNELK